MKWLLVTSLCVILGASTATASRRASGAVMNVALGEYYSTVYTAPPLAPAAYVWWRTEPLVLRVTVANAGADPLLFRMPSPSGTPFIVSIAPVGDSSPQVARVSWSSPTTRSPGRSELKTTLPAAVEGASSLRWTGETPDVSSLVPGIYRVDVRSELNLGGTSPSGIHDSLTIDVRDVVTDTDRLELLRIRATRCLRERQYDCADSFADTMAKIHPQAALAFWLKGQSAAARGDLDTARRHYSQSVELLESKADSIFTALNPEHRAAAFVAGIRARLKHLH